MKKILFLFLFLFFVSFASASTNITNCTELQNMNSNLSENYVLDNDIDCSDTINWNGGEGFVPIGNFYGSLEGQHFNITNLSINKYVNDNGLFSVLYGQVRNLNMINVSISGDENIGGISGRLFGSVINSSVSGEINGNQQVGGIAGLSYYGIISQSFSEVNITANSFLGGLVGKNIFGNISNSYSKQSFFEGVAKGGLVGQSEGSINIINSYTTNSIGYLIGVIYDDSTCINSYWDSDISGTITSSCGEGKTTEEMKLFSTFSIWDFDNHWGLNESYDYPCLLWQNGCFLNLLPIPDFRDSSLIYQVLESSGAGLGLFMSYVSFSLPPLMITLAFVLIISAIGYGLVKLLQKVVVP